MEGSMGPSQNDQTYSDWRKAVDERLKEIYYLTIEDAEIDEDYRVKHWESKGAAFEFVGWFGNKYDLDSLTLLVLCNY